MFTLNKKKDLNSATLFYNLMNYKIKNKLNTKLVNERNDKYQSRDKLENRKNSIKAKVVFLKISMTLTNFQLDCLRLAKIRHKSGDVTFDSTEIKKRHKRIL